MQLSLCLREVQIRQQGLPAFPPLSPDTITFTHVRRSKLKEVHNCTVQTSRRSVNHSLIVTHEILMESDSKCSSIHQKASK